MTEGMVAPPGVTVERRLVLAPERDNIHTFEAGPEGALGFDINTILPGEGDWSMVALDDQPLRSYERVFEARWSGKPKSG